MGKNQAKSGIAPEMEAPIAPQHSRQNTAFFKELSARGLAGAYREDYT